MLKQCVQIIAERGLQGIRYTELLEVLSYNNRWGRNIDCPIFREKLWSHISKLESLFFYCPPSDGLTEKTLHEKPQNVVDDQSSNLRGYCQYYEKITKLRFNDDLTYLDNLERYPNLFVSTVQDVRSEIYIKDTNYLIVSDLNANQYAVYEYYRRVGKRGFTSKDLQQAFACKAPSIVFYTEMLEKMGALKFLINVKSCGKQVSREHYWFHYSHEDSIRCIEKVMDDVMKISNRKSILSLEDLRQSFDDAVSYRELVDHADETFELIKYFLVKVAAVHISDDQKYINKKEVSITFEKKEMEPESEIDHAFYGDALVAGEPLDCQILQFIASKGDEGCSSNDVVAHFGIDSLIFRTVARTLMSDGRVETFNRVSKKTNQYVYRIKNSSVTNDVKESGKDESEHDFSNDVTHLSTNVERLKAIHRVFQIQKVVSRPEIRKFLRNESIDPSLAEIDGKTMKRLLNTLCKKGIIVHLVLKGSGASDKELDMYYLADCSKEELHRKIDIIKSRLERPQAHEAMEGISHVYLHAHSSLKFLDPIPESFEGFGDYTSPGVYHGPKMVFIQQFHLMLSILTYRWPVTAIIPSQHLNIKDWWEYVLKLDPIDPNKDGEYEVADFINYFPIYFLKYFNKDMVHDCFLEVMEDETYSRLCIGQLNKQLRVNLSGNISHVYHSFGKTIEVLEAMDLVEIKQKFDFTKKRFSGLRFSLRKRALLLNTAYAPIKKDFFRGYNIRRIHVPRRILVFNVTDFNEIINYWSKAQEICLSGTFHESASFGRNISRPAKSLLNVFKDNRIPLDQTEQFYNSPGTVERLNAIYSELGPGGFMIKLMTNKRDHWCVSLKPIMKKFRPDLAKNNVFRPTDNFADIKVDSFESNDRVDSDSDDYVTFTPRASRESKYLTKKVSKKDPSKKVQKKPKKEPSEESSQKESSLVSNSKFVPTGVRKRRLSVRDHSVAKRIRRKYRDDIDLQINSNKISERVKFSEKEDEVIIVWSVCLTLFGQPHCPNESRDLLHNCCPKNAADKTEESTKKRRALLLDRPEVQSRMVDLQSKGTAFKDMSIPRIDKAKDLFEQREEWAVDSFIVRSILPASFGDFIERHEIKEFKEAVNHLTVFLTEGYRNKRVLNFKECEVASIWKNAELADRQKQIYSILMLAVGTHSSQHNDTACKVIKSIPEEDLTAVSDYMYKHQILRRRKRRVTSEGNVAEGQRIIVNTDALQCLYSPFPDEVLSEPLRNNESLLEVHYSELSPKIVHDLSQRHFKGRAKVIISGAINPFIEDKKFEAVLGDVDSEDAAFAEIHTKRNTFFSGISTVDEGKLLGFQLSEKHISGRLNYKVHTPTDEEKVEGYEELLGIKESSWPLPLKIFIAPEASSGKFNWKSVDFGSGSSSSSDYSIEAPIFSPTELNSYELHKACIQNMPLPGNDSEKLQSYAHFCKISGSMKLIIPGQELLKQVFESNEAGIIEKDLLGNLVTKYELSVKEVEAIISMCINMELVLRVGYVEYIIVGKQYGISWLISVQSGSSESQPLVKEAKDERSPSQKIESNFSRYFPLTAKPWRSMTSDINISLLKDLTKSIVLFIYAYPGTSKELIDRRYHAYLSPIDSQELLESLMHSEIIKRCWDKPPSPGLFSSTRPQIMMGQRITPSSCFSVTDNGLNNFAAFVSSAIN